MRRTVFVLSLIVALFASAPSARQLPPYGGAAAYVADLAARRTKAMEALGPETILIAWSPPARVYSTDVDYEYRQESNLLYLTGDDQEDSILVLLPGAKTKKEILFTRPPNPTTELWNGHIDTLEEASAKTGIKNVYPTTAFQSFIDGLLAGTGYQQSPEEAAAEFGAFFDAVKQGKAKLGIFDRVGAGPGRGAVPGAPAPPPEPGSHAGWATALHDKYPGVTPASVASVIQTLRQIKTPYEQNLLRRSAEISAEAHIEGMKAAKPGRWEYEVEAAIEYWYLKNGAMSWGYPSIVGSGPNATTLHYEKSTRQMQNGDLLLVDAAANFQGLTADITRTYPVNGKFSPEQRAIYELVLEGQEAGIAAVKMGGRSTEITRAIRDVFGEGLFKLGLITESAPGAARDAQVGRWFPHGPTHGIGVDVHDPLGAFAPGAAFTIEPGLYIRQDTLDNLPKNAENQKFIEAVQPAVTKYKNIGVRIEDSFLMTDTGLVNLSIKAPRQIADIEKIIGTGK